MSFTPSVPGAPESAVIRIASNDPTAPFVDVTATGSMGSPTLVTPAIDTDNSATVGNVCLGLLRR